MFCSCEILESDISPSQMTEKKKKKKKKKTETAPLTSDKIKRCTT